MRRLSCLRVRGPFAIQGEVRVPGDKSISHRAVMLLALSRGEAKITGFPASSDCIATVSAFRSMGVHIDWSGRSDIVVKGVGLNGLAEPADIIDCGNSGTLMRLILGILAGHGFSAFLTGDASLRSRPMARVIRPLREMGATIIARKGDTLPPVAVKGGHLTSISFEPEVASAQVKSCVLMAGILADGVTEVNETRPTRDHTERMLEYLGAGIRVSNDRIQIEGGRQFCARDIEVPGDISSAAFALCIAAASPGSRLTVKSVGFNPTRTGIVKVLRRMGADLRIEKRWTANNESFADLAVSGRLLHGVDVRSEEVPDIIDEIPILSLVATQCRGTTTITGASELRVKESDRLDAIQKMLTEMGADVVIHGDDIEIKGPSKLRPCTIESGADHRIAMAAAMGAAFTAGAVDVVDVDCVATSFPGFEEFLRSLAGPDSVESFVLI